MNAIEMKNLPEHSGDADVTEQVIEKSVLVKLWARIKKAATVSDATLESWERIESKRHHARFEQNQWRNF